MSEPALLSIAFFGTALLFVVLGVPLRRRRVKPNILYGFRTPSTLRDPASGTRSTRRPVPT